MSAAESEFAAGAQGVTNPTFVVTILRGDHMTWQGSVHWTDIEQTVNFRSAAELIHLILNALDQSDVQGDYVADQRW